MAGSVQSACPNCGSMIKVHVMDLVPSMYPHDFDCDDCGARCRMAYPWTFSAHFLSFGLGAVLAVNTVGIHSGTAGFVGIAAGVYLLLSMALNRWYFKLGKPLVT